MNILFISGRLLPTASANAIISFNVIKELRKMGHNVTYIALNQDQYDGGCQYENIPVYSIPSTKFGKYLDKKKEHGLTKKETLIFYILKMFRTLCNVINIFIFPDVDPYQSRSTYNIVKELHNRESIDAIIGVFRPFSGVATAIRMKKEFPNIVCGAYYLDILSGSKKPRFIPLFLYKIISKIGEKRTFKMLDFALMIETETAKMEYSEERFGKLSKKLLFCNQPTFVISQKALTNETKKNANEISIVYAGMLYREIRNPIFLLRVLEELSKSIPNISLHVYGRGDCNDILDEFMGSIDIHRHGMVAHHVVLEALSNADFVVNISNTIDNMIPSKIFELFSTGKPVINFLKKQNDSSRRYFQKYPLMIEVIEWGDFVSEVEKVRKFICEDKGKRCDIDELSDRFIEFTPKYIAQMICQNIIDSQNCYSS